MSLLAVNNLTITFRNRRSTAETAVVKAVSFSLEAGETLGIVGESGSGKSMLSLAIMGLLPGDARLSGSIRLGGQEVVGASDRALDALRGREAGMIFQEPMTALNPAMTVGAQIAEGLCLRGGLSRADANAEALALMEQVRLPEARRRFASYPHEMSGGQRQRVGIAIALALKPRLLIADEPTTALDVTVQKDILDILDELVRERAMALILISHDLGVIARSAARTLVMYRGDMMEDGPTVQVLRQPQSDYTRQLIAALPRRSRRSLEGAAP
ncbi:ATP-binding cassette domain-containing protein [Radicibacter daui]|uniref:ATP-binding cassette domain-containing protein n=1 Tax=Radicibacter daui TaxID=3064829 RepID=UPI004046C7DB